MLTNKLLAIFFTSLLMISSAGATDRYVSLSGTNNYPYTNWPDAATDIQWAVNAGADNDTIWISNGVYVLTGQVTITKSLAIYGNPGETVVLDGNLANRCIYFNTAGKYIVLSNLFITRGLKSDDNGGGAFIYNGIIKDCIFSNNFSAFNGGGAFFSASGVTSTVQRCSFIGNTAGDGGGLYFYGPNAKLALIDDCRFYANIATNSGGDNGGGGMYANQTYSIITNCDFISNLATDNGGGAYVYYPKTNIFTHCTFASNTAVNTNTANNAGSGGGLFGRITYEYAFIISNCYISNNVAGLAGGGVFFAGGQIRNSVIARNIAQVFSSTYAHGGAGINANYYADDWTHLIQDCIIEGNTGGRWGGGMNLSKPTVVRNCLIRNNVSDGYGGGVFIYIGPSMFISGCTIVSNYAVGYGGGISGSGNTGPSYYGFYENCIICYNGSGIASSSNYYALADMTWLTNCLTAPAFSGALTGYATNCVSADPQFTEWTTGNYHLDRNSPAVNSGVIRDWMANTFDLDGRRRIDKFSGQVDMGCFEYLPSGTMYGFR